MLLNQRVKQLLEAKPALRNSDIKLILAVWISEGLQLTKEQIDYIINDCSPPESIRRNRQKLQEKGEVQADESVKQERKKKQEVYRNGGYVNEVSHTGYKLDLEKGIAYRI